MDFLFNADLANEINEIGNFTLRQILL